MVRNLLKLQLDHYFHLIQSFIDQFGHASSIMLFLNGGSRVAEGRHWVVIFEEGNGLTFKVLSCSTPFHSWPQTQGLPNGDLN